MQKSAKVLRKTPVLLTVAVLAIVLVDFISYQEPALAGPLGPWKFSQSIPWFLLGALLQVLIYCRKNRSAWPLRNRVLSAALAVITTSYLIEPSRIAGSLLFVGLVALSLALERGSGTQVGALVRNTVAQLALFWSYAVSDMLLLRRWRANRGSKGVALSSVFSRWFFPLLGGSVFLSLFWSSNPVFASLFSSIADLLSKIVLPPIDRLFLWSVTGAYVWSLMRARFFRPRVLESKQPAAPSRGSSAGVVRSLLVFNGIFALNNILDLEYLWGGLQLPPGVSFSEYAHQGAYSLLFTTILAALFIVVGFADGKPACADPKARKLVYLWSAQNILLLISTLLRLVRYVEAYALSELRLYVMIWCLVVLIGFGLLMLRLAKNRSNEWLIAANASTGLMVLVLCCLLNFNAVIAWYNVLHSEVNGGVQFDHGYAFSLGVEALPAIHWYEARVGRKLYFRSYCGAKSSRCSAAQIPSFSSEFFEARLMQETSGWRYESLRRKFLRLGLASAPQSAWGWLRVLLLN